MRLTRSEEDGTTVLEISGTVTLGESAREFAAALQQVFDETAGGVVVDLAAIDYVDSTGIGELVGHLQRFTEAGRRLALLRPQQRIEALLKLTRLERIFPIFHDREEAKQFARGEREG